MSEALVCDFIQAAGRWMTRLETGEAAPLSPLLEKAELVRALGCGVRSLRLWQTSWTNRIYQVKLEGGARAVAKQVCAGASSEAEHEEKHLLALA